MRKGPREVGALGSCRWTCELDALVDDDLPFDFREGNRVLELESAEGGIEFTPRADGDAELFVFGQVCQPFSTGSYGCLGYLLELFFSIVQGTARWTYSLRGYGGSDLLPTHGAEIALVEKAKPERFVPGGQHGDDAFPLIQDALIIGKEFFGCFADHNASGSGQKLFGFHDDDGRA